MSSTKKFLVTAATGSMGSSVCQRLLASGHAVKALVRNTEADTAKDLERRGAILVQGSFDDIAPEATDGCHGVFLNTQPGGGDEAQQARSVIDAAKASGVEFIVCSTVIRAEQYQTFPRLDLLPFMNQYWKGKAGVEELVQASGMKWTILQPSFLMSNFLDTKFYFPELKNDTLLWAADVETKIDMVAPEDVGAFAVAALLEPERLAGKRIRIASQQLTIVEAAGVLAEVSGKPIRAEARENSEDLIGENPLVWTQTWQTEAGLVVDLDELGFYGVETISLKTYLEGKRDEFLTALG